VTMCYLAREWRQWDGIHALDAMAVSTLQDVPLAWDFDHLLASTASSGEQNPLSLRRDAALVRFGASLIKLVIERAAKPSDSFAYISVAGLSGCVVPPKCLAVSSA
jgi:hypothetical protein